MNIFKKGLSNIIVNLLLVYVCYSICRLEFLLENWEIFRPSMTWAAALDCFVGGLVFDSSAIAYTNALYLLLAILPFPWAARRGWQQMLKWLFVVINAVAIVVNLSDSVYFPFTQQRTTALVFDEFSGENNLLTILGIELVRHWYLVLLAALLTYGLARLHRPATSPEWRPTIVGVCGRILFFLVMTFFTVCGMRGHLSIAEGTRPISVNNAHAYAATPLQTAIVLNTPFAIFRTLDNRPPQIPIYFTNQEELDSLYSPLYLPDKAAVQRRKNVVILIVESFAQEFVGALNRHLDGGTYRGYTPFADSLLTQSLTWQETISNSGFSIDAMPAVLASIPRMGRPFVLTPFSLNKLNSIATELGRWGYESAFFHGAPNGSMGFQAFSHSIGFQRYYGMDEYLADSRFGGKQDFDGTWAIWDEPFLQFYCQKMTEMHEPFVTTVFTASSHHPFHIPEEYRDTFPDEGKFPLHKCIRYTDHSLRRFFESAKQQAWYKNTLFVLTADHASSRITHDEYMTEVGLFRIPILFFDPSGEMPRGLHPGIAQQIDVMPTLLNYLGYDHPYIAFGKDLLKTSPEDTWAMTWDHIPQYMKGEYALHLDGKDLESVSAIFNYRTDSLFRQNLRGRTTVERQLEREFKARIQSFVGRMKENQVTAE
ncbi:MAG: LTA synthase family protein [Bacteroidaceae bacterium]|nr:LTA synthase family protein [Bacteroidaceae bacterium]